MTAEIPKATKGTGSNQYKKAEIDNNVEFSKPKSEALAEIGLQQKQAQRFERIAKYPEAVEKANQRALGGAVPQKSAKPVDTRQELSLIRFLITLIRNGAERINRLRRRNRSGAAARSRHEKDPCTVK